ncbi:MAG: hypothetical protein IKD85_04325 [Firmicutes bacterium]|nr:hypothetical protein [Bacillota bacterium]
MAEKEYGTLQNLFGDLPAGAEQEIDPVTEAVLLHFGTFCSVPHGSGNEARLTEILADCFAGEGRQIRIDEAGNLIVDIPASPGLEDAPLLMLQGHTDMVCAVRPGSGYVPERDRIQAGMYRDEKSGRLILSSCGDSSLGADCGLGDAGILWLFGRPVSGPAERQDEAEPAGRQGSGGLRHGPVRIVMTVNEENGLGGALELSPEVFDGVRYVINVDGFTCGLFVAGSAGGRREKYSRDAELTDTAALFEGSTDELRTFEVCLSGFTGGHSGSDIAEGRVNALWMMGRFLEALTQHGVRYALSSFTGGSALNAIPGDSEAVLTVDSGSAAEFQNCLLDLIEAIRHDYRDTDDRGHVTYYETKRPEKAFSKECCDALTGFVSSLTVGVKKYMDDMPDTPETSCNLGAVSARAGAERMQIHLFERSMGGRSHEELLEEHRRLSARFGFRKVYGQNYPAWAYRQDNRLPHLAKELFEKETGRPGAVKAVHVGLEPAVFYDIDPTMQMVCMGADVLDPHSVHERVPVDTIRPFARTLRRLVEAIGERKE